MRETDLQDKYEIRTIDKDLYEYQGSPEFIAAMKAKDALKFSETAVLIEDSALCFNAMNGLPGPYIKDFVDRLGP